MHNPIAPLTEALADRFLREIRTTGNLRHPHIVPLYDSGESLEQLMEREGPLPLDRALGIFSEVTDSLAYAQARGVVSPRHQARERHARGLPRGGDGLRRRQRRRGRGP